VTFKVPPTAALLVVVRVAIVRLPVPVALVNVSPWSEERLETFRVLCNVVAPETAKVEEALRAPEKLPVVAESAAAVVVARLVLPVTVSWVEETVARDDWPVAAKVPPT
jgi:hypothetical protein